MERLVNQTLWERVHEYLRRQILTGEIAPGAVLQEVALARSLGMSRGPIREAIGRLAAEGLVDVTPRRGAVVAALTASEFADAYQVREALESLAVELAVPRLSEADLGALEGLIDEMASCDPSDATTFFELNAQFHDAWVAAAHNRILLQMYRRLIAQMTPYRRLSAHLRGSLIDSVNEHREILAAARIRDADRTAVLVRQHIRVPQNRLHAINDSESGWTAPAAAKLNDEP